MKYGLHTDGRKCGPIDPQNVNEKGWTWFDTAEERDAAIPGPTLDEVEAECLQNIDQKASEVRDRFITSGVGQEATYLEKFEEAKAYKAASSPTDSDYPLLNAESQRRGMTMAELADEVIARRTSWIDPAAAQVEAERVGGKQDVRAASTVADKESARDAAIAALDAIQP